MKYDHILEAALAVGLTFELPPTKLIRFAQIIAAHEREECAQVAEEWQGPTKDRELHIADAIRSRT